MKNILIALTTTAMMIPLATVAEARHNDNYRQRSVRVIAHDLEKATRYVHRAMEHRYSARHYRDTQALRDFHSLEDRARHFHRAIERYSRDPWHALRDYQTLADSYNRAYRNLRYMRVSENIYQDFRHVGSLMAELDSYYRRASYRSRPGGRYRGSYDGNPNYRRRHGGDYGVRIQLPRIEIQWDWRH